MDKIKKKTTPLNIIMIAVCYLSFALAQAYFSRSVVARFNTPLIANALVGALVGGIVPAVVFELGVRFFTRPLVGIVPKVDSTVLRLRLFFIGGNVAVFLLSLMLYAHPFLSVWAGILLSFVVLLIALIAFLVTEFKMLADKSKMAYIVMQAGVLFLFLTAALTVLGALLEKI